MPSSEMKALSSSEEMTVSKCHVKVDTGSDAKAAAATVAATAAMVTPEASYSNPRPERSSRKFSGFKPYASRRNRLSLKKTSEQGGKNIYININ